MYGTTSDVWGRLVILRSKLSVNHIDLTDETFLVGRRPACNLSISEETVSRNMIHHISRKHFLIKKQIVCGILIVHISDLSSNGTFVNGVRIGRENTFTLFDGDRIAIGKAGFEMFTFQDLYCGRHYVQPYGNVHTEKETISVSQNQMQTKLPVFHEKRVNSLPEESAYSASNAEALVNHETDEICHEMLPTGVNSEYIRKLSIKTLF